MITARSASLFSRPFHGLCFGLLPIPAMNRWAIFNRPLTRTQGSYFLRNAPPCTLKQLFECSTHLLNSAGIHATNNQGQHIQSLEIALVFKDQFKEQGRCLLCVRRKSD